MCVSLLYSGIPYPFFPSSMIIFSTHSRIFYSQSIHRMHRWWVTGFARLRDHSTHARLASLAVASRRNLLTLVATHRRNCSRCCWTCRRTRWDEIRPSPKRALPIVSIIHHLVTHDLSYYLFPITHYTLPVIIIITISDWHWQIRIGMGMGTGISNISSHQTRSTRCRLIMPQTHFHPKIHEISILWYLAACISSWPLLPSLPPPLATHYILPIHHQIIALLCRAAFPFVQSLSC